MISERSTSIHDLGSAPAAPASSALSDLSASSPSAPRLSPIESKRTRSFSPAMRENASMPELPDHHDAAATTPRMRSDTAPGRLGNIPEKENCELEDARSISSASHPNRRRSNNSMWNEYEYDDDDLPHHNSSSTIISSRTKRWFGFDVPNMARISSFLVRKAPCFWGCGTMFDFGATDRQILYRLNLLCAFFALGEVVAASFLAVVLYSKMLVDRNSIYTERVEESQKEGLNFWSLNATIFFLGILASLVLVTVIYTLKIVREVNLTGSVRYLWMLVWLLPLQIFFVISLIDYHRVTQVWVKQYWSLPSMAWFRQLYCAEGTANKECIIPVDGGLENDVISWCRSSFNATDCSEIRDEAQKEMLRDAYIFYYSCATWGAMLAFLIILTISMLEGIITKPIVQASRESNVPAWMLLPTVGCLATGAIFVFSAATVISGGSESTNSQWVGVLYILCGGCFFMSALLGWFIGTFSILNSRDKRNKNIAVICFIMINVLMAFMLGAIFVGSILVSTDLVDVPLTETERGRTACDIDTSGSCTLCRNRVGKLECPEWTEGEVIKILQTQYKQSATLAAIFFLYAISALRFGIMNQRHISLYQIDYV